MRPVVNLEKHSDHISNYTCRTKDINGSFAFFPLSASLLASSDSRKKRIKEEAAARRTHEAPGQCWILKRVPNMNDTPDRNAEMRRNRLFLLRVYFQSTPREDGKKRKARIRAPKDIRIPAPGKCPILSMTPKPSITVPATPEIFIKFFIMLYLVSTA